MSIITYESRIFHECSFRDVAEFATSVKIYFVGDKVFDAVKLRGFDGRIVVLLRYLAPKLEDEVFGQGGTER